MAMVIALFAVMVFGVFDVVRSAEDDVAVDVSSIDVCGHNIGIFPLQKPVRKLHADLVRLLKRHFSRQERLYQVEGFVGISLVGLGEGKFEIISGCFRAAPKGRNEDALIGLMGVADVCKAVGRKGRENKTIQVFSRDCRA